MRTQGDRRARLAVLPLVLLAGCRSLMGRPSADEPPEPLPVKKVEEEIVVAAWAEPKELPTGGGQTQLIVRVQKRGGAPFPGVEARFNASAGTLFSEGKVLITDNRGMTRDRLTTHQTTWVTLNAGGTRYRFRVPVVAADPP